MNSSIESLTYRGPVVGPGAVFTLAQVDHRLDREHMAHLHTDTKADRYMDSMKI
jgi:hypothetical protein